MNILGWGSEADTPANTDTNDANATNEQSTTPVWYDSAFNWYHSDNMQGARNELDKTAANIVKEVVASDNAEKTDANKKKYQDIKNKTDKSSFDFSKISKDKNMMYIAGAAIIVTAFMYFDKNKTRK